MISYIQHLGISLIQGDLSKWETLEKTDNWVSLKEQKSIVLSLNNMKIVKIRVPFLIIIVLPSQYHVLFELFLKCITSMPSGSSWSFNRKITAGWTQMGNNQVKWPGSLTYMNTYVVTIISKIHFCVSKQLTALHCGTSHSTFDWHLVTLKMVVQSFVLFTKNWCFQLIGW